MTGSRVDPEFLERNILPANDEEAYSATIRALDIFLADVEAAKRFIDEDDNRIISLSNIIMYAYIREALDFTPNSPAMKEFKSNEKYRKLLRYVEWIGRLDFYIKAPRIDAKRLAEISSKYKLEITTSFPLGSRVIPKGEVVEDTKEIKLAKCGAWSLFFIGLTLLNFATSTNSAVSINH